MTMRSQVQIIIDNGAPTGGEFSMDVAQIEISSFVDEPNPGWTLIDSAGHYHAYTADLKLPTLVAKDEVVTYDEPDEDGETGYTIRHLHCLICDEEIKPGRRWDSGRKFAPGRVSWSVTVNGEAVPGERKSVRVINGDQMFFGVGEVGDVRDDHGQPALFIYGVSDLGKRRAPQRAGG